MLVENLLFFQASCKQHTTECSQLNTSSNYFVSPYKIFLSTFEAISVFSIYHFVVISLEKIAQILRCHLLYPLQGCTQHPQVTMHKGMWAQCDYFKNQYILWVFYIIQIDLTACRRLTYFFLNWLQLYALHLFIKKINLENRILYINLPSSS